MHSTYSLDLASTHIRIFLTFPFSNITRLYSKDRSWASRCQQQNSAPVFPYTMYAYNTHAAFFWWRPHRIDQSIHSYVLATTFVMCVDKERGIVVEVMPQFSMQCQLDYAHYYAKDICLCIIKVGQIRDGTGAYKRPWTTTMMMCLVRIDFVCKS